MENITITIDTENAAFDDEPATEIARLLRYIAGNLENFGIPQSGSLYDINGNICGAVTITPLP